MDLWDVIRLMVRRWYVAVPMLALTFAAVGWTAVAVSPNYTAEAQVMVLPPSGQRDTEPGEERVVNPWDVNSLAGAIVTMLRNHNLAEQMEEEGYRAAWEAGTDLQFQAVIVIKVTSPTGHEAQAAAARLLQAVQNEVSGQQAPFTIPENEKITAVVLGAGENVDVVRGNQIRAMVVVLAALLILTLGVTIGFDAVARRRAVRQTGRLSDAAAPSSPAPQYAGVNGERSPALVGTPYVSANGRGTEAAAAGGGGGTVYTAKTSQDSRSEPPEEEAPAGDDRPAMTTKATPIQISYRPPQHWPATPPQSPHGTAGVPPDADDSTIVLPLSGTARRSSKRSPATDQESRGQDATESSTHEAGEH